MIIKLLRIIKKKEFKLIYHTFGRYKASVQGLKTPVSIQANIDKRIRKVKKEIFESWRKWVIIICFDVS